MNLEIYNEITSNNLLSYKLKMAVILLDKQEVYDVLEEYATKSMVREGMPSSIFERVYKELYETKAWYIPDRLKIWDRRFGKLFERPFFAYDDDVDTWDKILKFYRDRCIPKKEDYENTRAYNRDWEFFAEMLVVAEHNKHPLFDESYHILKEHGLSNKVYEKKQAELKKYLQNNQFGFKHL